MRDRLIAANWKMHKTASEADAFTRTFLDALGATPEGAIVVLCPPFTALSAVARVLDELRPARVGLGAQNMYWERSGAFTGEVSAQMLLGSSARYVILGHSERRQYFGETDAGVNRKTAAALAAGLVPIVAVGETLALREANRTGEHVRAQTQAAFAGIAPRDVARAVMAYEPVWAIGTGKNCDASEADAVMQTIRESVDGLSGVPILYGGSVKAENVAAYTARDHIDGALVGGASLDPSGFAQLVQAACGATRCERGAG